MGQAPCPVSGFFRFFGVHKKYKARLGVESLNKGAKAMRGWPQAPGTVLPYFIHRIILPDAGGILKTDPHPQFESDTGKTEFRFANISIFRPRGLVWQH